MFHWLRRTKITAPDGKYDFHIIPAPGPGVAQESVFNREYQDPLYPLVAGPGKPTRFQLRVLQQPQVLVTPVSATYGPGGIPSPDQTFDLQSLEGETQ